MAGLAIPPNLHEEVLGQSGQGKTTYEISQWLRATHGVEASYRAVARLLQRVRKERAGMAQDIVRARLQKELPRDLDALAHQQRILASLQEAYITKEGTLRVGKDVREYLAVHDRITRVLDLKLYYSGAGGAEPAGAMKEDPRAALMDRLGKLVAAAEPAPETQVH